jgi:hypothetical protein
MWVGLGRNGPGVASVCVMVGTLDSHVPVITQMLDTPGPFHDGRVSGRMCASVQVGERGKGGRAGEGRGWEDKCGGAGAQRAR